MSLPRTLGELQLYRVLQRANLLAYYDTFIQQGGDDVQQLCEAGEEEFLEIMALVGMATKPLHVRRLQKALREWATNPSLFNQTLSNVPVNSIPLFKISDTTGGRKSLSNGHASNSPGEQERSGLTPQRSSSPKSPSSQTSELSRDKLQLSPFGRHTPEPDGHSQDEEQPSPPPTPPATSSPVPGGQLEPEAARAVTESVDRLMKTMPCADPSEVKALLKLNKKLAKTVGHIFNMENSDPAKEEEIRKYSLIYGRFDSKRREGKQLSAHELTINEAAAQFCMRDNALLLRRVELFSLARQVARECAYTSTLRGSRLNPDDLNGPALKKIKHEVTVSECVSSSRDLVGGQQGTPESSAPGFHHTTDEDSLSGESLDGHTQGLGSRSSLSLSPCPPTDPTPTPTWSRHLMQQTLMDEGLRLARLVSHDRVGKLCLRATGSVQPTEYEEKVTDSSRPSRRSSSCSSREEQESGCK